MTDMKKLETIKDIQQFQELIKLANGIEMIMEVFDFGDDLKSDSTRLKKEIEELSTVPDRFNNHFSERGWIIYENLNYEIAKEALALADAGRMEEAEDILVEYFSVKNITFWLKQMRNSVKAFNSRHQLAKLALRDYEEGRYHASIPVVLALLDGLVNELNGNKGFFANKTELEAWDSISAHKKGLVALGKIFKKGRYQTQTEEIRIPYRNGIMHGMDLGYANKIVAAKTWAILFAVQEWCIKAENDKLDEPELNPLPSLSEALHDLKQSKAYTQELKKWQPREFTGNEDYLSEDPSDYEEHTPERSLIEFFKCWKSKNYGKIVEFIQTRHQTTSKRLAGIVRDGLKDKELISYHITSVKDTVPAISRISTTISCKYNGEIKNKDIVYTLTYLKDPSDFKTKNYPPFDWVVINWGLDILNI